MNFSEDRTVHLLLASLDNLKASLRGEYDPLPQDPKREFTSAANSVVFLCRCVLVELMKSADLTGTGALYLSIAVGDFESFSKLVGSEIRDLLENEPDKLAEFKEQIRKALKSRSLGEIWEGLL